MCFAFTLAVYTYVGLLCGSGISFCCQSHLVPVLFRFWYISLHTLSFFKMFFIILVSILFLNNSGKFLIKYVMTILFHLQYWYFLQEWCPEGDSTQNLLQYYNYLLLQFLHPLSFLNMFLYYSCFDSIFKWLGITICW